MANQSTTILKYSDVRIIENLAIKPVSLFGINMQSLLIQVFTTGSTQITHNSLFVTQHQQSTLHQHEM